MDYNYVEGTFELMVGVACCRNENNLTALNRIWEANKEVNYYLTASVICPRLLKSLVLIFLN